MVTVTREFAPKFPGNAHSDGGYAIGSRVALSYGGLAVP
jgi:hypothetical protein